MLISVEPGEQAWQWAGPLLDGVWPPEVRANASWAKIKSQRARRRVLVRNDAGDVVCHVGIYGGPGTLDGKEVNIGGIGGVATREDARRQGYARRALGVALDELRNKGADFALLFCELHNLGFYERSGWHRFTGKIFCEQQSGRMAHDIGGAFVFDLKLAARDGAIDLCGLPW
jgi:aminoglycoside 2'-N-acetyltransferase I